jgi:hypothetical protein
MTMFNFNLAGKSHKTKDMQLEYTPILPSHPPIHDNSEGSEYLDEPLRMIDEPFSRVEELDKSLLVPGKIC